MKNQNVSFKSIEIDGLNNFYREAGNPENPKLLLLGGFPSSSNTFQGLIEKLKKDFHLIAPDYPGFGYSDPFKPEIGEFTFDNLALNLEKFIDLLGMKSFHLYAFDYGGPIGFRLASKFPGYIKSLIIQNATAHTEGLGIGFNDFMPFLQNRNSETEKPLRNLFSLDGIKIFYLTGAENPEAINPDLIHADLNHLMNPDRIEDHLDLLHNYSSNLGHYPEWQNYFKTQAPPALLVWGKNDPFFPEAAAQAFKKDLPHADLYLYPTSHFALTEYGDEIADRIREFISKQS